MSGYAFFKKEIKTILKTYRVWLIPLIFVFLGIFSPVTAKFMPAIVKSALQSDATQKMVIQFKLPEPTQADAYMQWIKNLSQFGMLALILISMGLISEEKTRNTLPLIATKPVSRTAIVISKFVAQAGLLAVSGALGLATCYLYTYLLFDKASFTPLALSSIAFATYALLILSITVFFSSLMKNQMGAGGLGLLAYFTLSIVAALGHGLDKYSPGALSTLAYKLTSGGQTMSAGYTALAISVAASLLFIVAAAVALERQEL